MNKLSRSLVGLLALLGLGVSLYLTVYHFRVLTEPDFASACKFNDTFDCDKVNSSSYGKVFGVPLGFYGAGFYLAMLALWGFALSGGEKFERAMELIFGFSVLSSLTSIGLFIISATQIKAFCPFCMVLYGVNFLMLGFSAAAAGGGVRAIVGRLDKELSGFLRSPMLYTVAGLFFGVVVLGNGYYQEQVRQSDQKKVEDFLKSKPRELKNEPAQMDEKGHPGDAHADAEKKAAESEIAEEVVNFKRLGHEPVRGKEDAPVTITIFSDFQCPYCQAAAFVLEQVVAENPGLVTLIYMQYPLDMECNPYLSRPMHEHGCKAAVGAICAGRQGQFWEMHDQLFRNQSSMGVELITQSARALGLDMTAFEACQADRNVYVQINQDIEAGKAIGINGTPAIYINGRKWKGSLTPEALSTVIRKLAAG